VREPRGEVVDNLHEVRVARIGECGKCAAQRCAPLLMTRVINPTATSLSTDRAALTG
jgi:hypothetical protein